MSIGSRLVFVEMNLSFLRFLAILKTVKSDNSDRSLKAYRPDVSPGVHQPDLLTYDGSIATAHKRLTPLCTNDLLYTIQSNISLEVKAEHVFGGMREPCHWGKVHISLCRQVKLHDLSEDFTERFV